MAWPNNPRPAKSLTKLLEQVNAMWPLRSKASDGMLASGDHTKANPTSDHEPRAGVVCALDITHDPANGLNSEVLADTLRNSRDDRIKYIISNSKIASSKANWDWRPYTGSNNHSHHMHLSVHGKYDDTTPWAIESASRPAVPPDKLPKQRPVLRKGAKGSAVGELQTLLNKHGATLKVDDDFGPATDKAVKTFQKINGLVEDGIVGNYSWDALEGK